MARKNANTATTKPKIRKIAGKPKPAPKAKGAPVSRASRVRATGRGGRGR